MTAPIQVVETAPPTTRAESVYLTATESGESRYFANAVASWYCNTHDPYAPHTQNNETRLRHPVHVVTRRILYGNVHQMGASDNTHEDNLELLFNDDDATIKDGPEHLTRRTAARMEAFLSSCSVALREDEEIADTEHTAVSVKSIELKNAKKGKVNRKEKTLLLRNSYSPRVFRQIDHGDLMLRLEVYCRTLRRIRLLKDASPDIPMEECVFQYESKKSIRSRVRLIVQTYLRNVDCVRDVHKTLMTLVLRATLECLAVEVWSEDLRGTVDRLASEFEHKVSFASLAFLSSPESSAETHLVPLLTKFFEYLQMHWKSLVSKCELERMLRTVLDEDLRSFFKNAVFHSVGHILDECRRERESLDNIALPPPWMEGVFGMPRSGNAKGGVDAAINGYISEQGMIKQALRDLRREVVTVNGQILPPAHSHSELAEYLGEILHSNQLLLSSSPGGKVSRRKALKRSTNYTSDFGLETEDDLTSGGESDTSLQGHIDSGFVDVLAKRLLITGAQGAGGDAYFIVRDLFGGEEVEVVPHHSTGRIKHRQGTIEILVRMNDIIIKTHAKFDVFSKPVSNDLDPLVQFHTTTTETIALEQDRTSLREKETKMTGWRTIAIRPAYYERISMH